MKIRILLTGVLLAVAASVFALSSEYTNWAQGPAQFLMTKEEVAQWKAIETDDEAKAFIALFWARRDPTPGTMRNEYHEQFDAAVEYADANLAYGKRVKGSMSDRGKTLILYGQPKKIERSAIKPIQTGSFDDDSHKDQDVSQWTQWIYEGDAAKEIFGVQRAVIRFTDRMGTGDFRADHAAVDLVAAQQRAIAKSITQPNLTEAPTSAPAAAAVPAPAAGPAGPAVQTQLTTASLASAVDAFKTAAKNPYSKPIFASWGEYVTGTGEYYVPVMLYVPKTSAVPATGLTFFGVVQDESGKNVLAFEKPATLLATKDDFYVDTSLSLPAGKLRGIFGLAENGTPVAMISSEMNLAGSIDKDAWAVSPLLLSDNVYPMTTAQAPTDPFAFGGVKVIPKADRTFHAADELWYFFEVRNPGIAEPAAPAEGTVPVTAAAGTPKIQIKIDVEGTDAQGKKHKMAAPPREIEALEMKGVPGHYGIGSAIPLSSFAPGDYTFTVKVIDTLKKTSATVSEKFKVVP